MNDDKAAAHVIEILIEFDDEQKGDRYDATVTLESCDHLSDYEVLSVLLGAADRIRARLATQS